MKELLKSFAKVAFLCTVVLSLSFSLTTFPASAETYKQDIKSNQRTELKQNSKATNKEKQKVVEIEVSESQSPKKVVEIDISESQSHKIVEKPKTRTIVQR